jgi:hypothetical protein
LAIVGAMRARRRGGGASALLVGFGTLLLAGCSPDLPKLDNPPRVRVPGAPCPTAPVSSPKEPVLRMWCRLERGDIAGAAAAYDPRARRALGGVLTDTLEDLRKSRVYSRASIVEVQSSAELGPRAIVHVARPGKKRIRAWYRLARRGSGWAITWDTTLRYSLLAYLQPAEASVPVPSPRAKRDVIVAAVRRYDALFVEAPGNNRERRSP